MTRPNILCITVDSLRADHTSCCVDDPAVETPAIDKLAESGVTFTTAISQGSFTTFSMPSLFSSRYPSGLHYRSYDGDDLIGVAIGSEPTMTEALSEAGYSTVGNHSNPLLSSLFEFDQGFDEFDADIPFGSRNVSRSMLLLTKLRRLFRKHAYLPAEKLTDKNVDWIHDYDGSGPFFLWTHYMDPHGPYQSKSGLSYYNKYRAEKLWQKAVHNGDTLSASERDTLAETYREEVRYTDHHIGRLIEQVRAESERPLVVALAADHGDGFGEHGFYSHPHELYEELIHVPLVISLPSSSREGERVSDPVELLDLAPTLLDAAGVTSPETFEGDSLIGSIEDGPTETADPVVFSEAQLDVAYVGAVRTPSWKYISHGVDGTEHLFALLSDPGEQEDVSETNPDVVARLSEMLAAHRARDAVTGQKDDVNDGELPSGEIEGRLKRLGYLE